MRYDFEDGVYVLTATTRILNVLRYSVYDANDKPVLITLIPSMPDDGDPPPAALDPETIAGELVAACQLDWELGPEEPNRHLNREAYLLSRKPNMTIYEEDP